MYLSELFLLELKLYDKSISFDLDMFESGELNKLFIVGYLGSGKTILGEYLRKKYKVELIHLDICCFPIVKKMGDTKQAFKLMYDKCLLPHLKNNKRQIIESAYPLQMYYNIPSLRNKLLSYPVIIIKSSLNKSTKQAIDRIKPMESFKSNKEKTEHFKELNKDIYKPTYEMFKKDKLKQKNNVNEFKIPMIN